jgi:hypothetical protein
MWLYRMFVGINHPHLFQATASEVFVLIFAVCRLNSKIMRASVVRLGQLSISISRGEALSLS